MVRNKNHGKPLANQPKSASKESDGRVLQQVQTTTFSEFSGPLPDPETLSEYASVDKTLPGRIVTMAEKQQEHAIDIEKRILDHNAKTQQAINEAERRGQWFALCVCLVGLIGGIYLISAGRMPGFGVLLSAGAILSTLAGLAYAFINGKKRNEG